MSTASHEQEDMEKRIELEKRGGPAEQIKELNLDNCRATQIAGLTDAFVNLTSLSLINVGLTTLKGFPNLPSLRKLELSDNRITGGLNLLQGCPKLTYLNLSGNKIKDLETLEPLKKLTELRNLDLFNCEVTNNDNYREKVFELLDGLVYLDGYDRNDQEAEEDDVDSSVNEDDDEEDDDDENDDVDDENGEEVGLEYLQKPGELEDDSEEDDFDPGEGDVDEEDDFDDDDDLDEEDDVDRGLKRKRPADDDEDDDDDDDDDDNV